MNEISLDTNDVILEALEKYSDMVRRICFIYLRSQADVEDVFQEVFLKLLQNKVTFESEEHEKAWLCRVAINKCKDMLKSFWRRNVGYVEGMELLFEVKEENDVMQEVLSLPQKYKDVVYLFYYEGYSVPEMAKLLDQKINTIYSNLHRARGLLKTKLGGIDNE